MGIGFLFDTLSTVIVISLSSVRATHLETILTEHVLWETLLLLLGGVELLFTVRVCHYEILLLLCLPFSHVPVIVFLDVLDIELLG